MFEILFVFFLGLSYLLYRYKVSKEKLISIKCQHCGELVNYLAGEFQNKNSSVLCKCCNKKMSLS